MVQVLVVVVVVVVGSEYSESSSSIDCMFHCIPCLPTKVVCASTPIIPNLSNSHCSRFPVVCLSYGCLVFLWFVSLSIRLLVYRFPYCFPHDGRPTLHVVALGLPQLFEGQVLALQALLLDVALGLDSALRTCIENRCSPVQAKLGFRTVVDAFLVQVGHVLVLLQGPLEPGTCSTWNATYMFISFVGLMRFVWTECHANNTIHSLLDNMLCLISCAIIWLMI